ncbi:MAG: MBL fold metallo-hydrolase [Sedimentisphaerales bacterium]|jgi:glyoxylase-like metal-dependent hydrolase (beta-lactamase superfamily II)
MKVDRLVLGEYENNCYIVRSSDEASDCLIIDTGLDVLPLLKFLERGKLTPVAVILTHGHIDHIAGVEVLRKKYPSILIYIHKLDAEMLTNKTSNLSLMAGNPFAARKADYFLDEGDIIEKAGVRLRVIHTPGHTPGGICLYAEKDNIIFVGDTLFAGSVGRTDFPGSSTSQLIEGITKKLLTLPEDTIVYPGHGPETTIGREKADNPFLS